MDLLAFTLLSVGIIAIPGPNVLVIVSTSISSGPLRGLQTVAGTSLAMAIQLGVAAVGTAWLVAALGYGFQLLKWIGVGYLLYLGITHLLRASKSGSNPAQSVSARGSFHRGFWVSLTNPKTILFFSAFLPQFATQPESYFTQLVILSGLFWLLAVSLDSAYALLASRLMSVLKPGIWDRYREGASGLILIGAATALATSNRAQNNTIHALGILDFPNA